LLIADALLIAHSVNWMPDGRAVLHLNNRLLLSRVPGRQHDLVPVGPVEIRVADKTASTRREVMNSSSRSPPFSTTRLEMV
jgi:hypothetical protein